MTRKWNLLESITSNRGTYVNETISIRYQLRDYGYPKGVLNRIIQL